MIFEVSQMNSKKSSVLKWGDIRNSSLHWFTRFVSYIWPSQQIYGLYYFLTFHKLEIHRFLEKKKKILTCNHKWIINAVALTSCTNSSYTTIKVKARASGQDGEIYKTLYLPPQNHIKITSKLQNKHRWDLPEVYINRRDMQKRPPWNL